MRADAIREGRALFDSIDPLGQLRDIHEPAYSPWPPSLMGWLLLVAIVMGIALTGWWRWRRYVADPRRAASRKLADLRRRRADGEAVAALVAELATLLRRIVLVQCPRAHVAGLCGRRWLEFLDREFVPQAFIGGCGECLTWAPYARAADVDVAALLALAESVLASSIEPGSNPRGVRSGMSGFGNLRGRALRWWRLARGRWRARNACIVNDAARARAALLQLAQLRWPEAPPRGLEALAVRLDDRALGNAFAQLDRCLYADGEYAWQGRRLWETASAAFKRFPPGVRRGDALPELYA